MRRSIVGAMAAVGALVVAACGGGDGGPSLLGSSVPDTSTAPAATDAPETTAGGGGAVGSIDDAKGAVVQVLAEGSFRDPENGFLSGRGSGSGFIIDPSGIVVTNNHVVTGAGAVKVRVGGEDEEIPAKVLGVSECSDLAVLQLVDPGPYPYLEWFDGDIEPPLEVYAAGFPLGDPEYTITRGVVSKAEADGQMPWASVRSTIEHDANIQPGNSGGPLLTEEGRIAGVNYALFDAGTGTSQFLAISPDLAVPTVEQLESGDVESIGVNGEAIVVTDEIAGVWVAGVDAGSPAADAGVLPGDIILSLNGVQMTPGTLEGYCDVLRTSKTDEAIAVEIVRFDTSEVWQGELNGTPLEFAYSIDDGSGGGGGSESAFEILDVASFNPPEGGYFESGTPDDATLAVFAADPELLASMLSVGVATLVDAETNTPVADIWVGITYEGAPGGMPASWKDIDCGSGGTLRTTPAGLTGVVCPASSTTYYDIFTFTEGEYGVSIYTLVEGIDPGDVADLFFLAL